MVYLRSGRGQTSLLDRVAATGRPGGCGGAPAGEDEVHDDAVGAQILRELGVRSAR